MHFFFFYTFQRSSLFFIRIFLFFFIINRTINGMIYSELVFWVLLPWLFQIIKTRLHKIVYELKTLPQRFSFSHISTQRFLCAWFIYWKKKKKVGDLNVWLVLSVRILPRVSPRGYQCLMQYYIQFWKRSTENGRFNFGANTV